jgi:hypothetical protein
MRPSIRAAATSIPLLASLCAPAATLDPTFWADGVFSFGYLSSWIASVPALAIIGKRPPFPPSP